MTCPHCGHYKMRLQDVLSRPDSLQRQSVVGGGIMVQGYSCYKCGHWVEPEFTPVMPMSAVTAVPPRGPSPAGQKRPTMADNLVREHWQAIRDMLAIQLDLVAVRAYLRKFHPKIKIKAAYIQRAIDQMRLESACPGGGL